RQAIRAGPQRVAEAAAGRVREDVAGADRVLLRRPATAAGDGPELERPVAVEDHEDLLLDGVQVRRRALPAGREDAVVQAAPRRAGGTADRTGGAAELRGRVLQRNHVRGPLAGLRELGHPELGLVVPRMVIERAD